MTEVTCPEPMVCQTALAVWSQPLAAALAPKSPVACPAGFEPQSDWPAFGLRAIELAALKFLHAQGPMPRDDFHKRFKRAASNKRIEVLHDLNRLGLIRLVENSDGRIWLQVTTEPDFDELERTQFS